jgi:hypothetical protein
MKKQHQWLIGGILVGWVLAKGYAKGVAGKVGL